jgi:outer membrane immunogenic protein
MPIRKPQGGVTTLRLGAVAIAAFWICGSASAADMPLKTPVGVLAVIPATPVPSWTACYIGGNIGGGWALKDWASPSNDLDGGGILGDRGTAALGSFVGGGQIGCDYQFAGSWVIGIQGLVDGADLKGNILDSVASNLDLGTRIDWFAAVTGRLGYALIPSGLLYVKGGVAWVRDRHAVLDQSLGLTVESADATRTGWAAGVGFEYMFLPNWSAFVEYDYMGFGTKTVSFTAPGGSFSETWDIRQNVQAVVVGLNFRFNFGKAPAEAVVAKY